MSHFESLSAYRTLHDVIRQGVPLREIPDEEGKLRSVCSCFEFNKRVLLEASEVGIVTVVERCTVIDTTQKSSRECKKHFYIPHADVGR